MRFIFLFLILTIPFFAQESSPFSMKESLPSVSHHQITPKVNVISGDYMEEACDLVVAGAQPLTLRRFYSQNNGYQPGYNFWRFNPEHCCAGNFELKEDFPGEVPFVAICDANGSISCLHKSGSKEFSFDMSKQSSFIHLEQNGQAHPLNTKISYRKGEEKHCIFRWEGEIVSGNGARRTFRTKLHSWLLPLTLYEFPRWREGPYEVKPSAWTPYLLPVSEEKLPNGNLLLYTYDSYYQKEDFPTFYLLTSITAYNASKTKELGFLKFHYLFSDKHRRSLLGVQVTGSDQRTATFNYDWTDEHIPGYGCLKYLSRVSSPNQPTTTYTHAQNKKDGRKTRKSRLREVARPDGRFYITDYDRDGRAHARYAPLISGAAPTQTHRYAYHKGGTNVFEAEGVQSVYRFDQNERIIVIESYLYDSLYRIERNHWDASNGNLLQKQIEDDTGKIYWKADYLYDENQNVIQEQVGDETSSCTVLRTFSKDGFNLKLTESDRPGKKTCYSYLPNTNLLISELVYEDEKIRKRAFHFYDDCAIRIKTIVDDGTTSGPNDLTHVTYRRITEIRPKQTYPCFGLSEEVQEKTLDLFGGEILLKKVCYKYHPSGQVLQEDHYDANGAYRYSIHNTYDEKEQLASTKDPLGHNVTFEYDNNLNLKIQKGPRPDMQKEWTYDLVGRPIEEKIQGSNTNLITKKQYDCLGRVKVLRNCTGNETHYTYGRLNMTVTHPDGGEEKKDYTVLGHVIKETNPLGEITHKTYNFQGQVTHILYPDATQESFTYTEYGMLASQVDRNGIKTTYEYDIFDHPIKQAVYSSSGILLKAGAATYSPFHKLSETDVEGVTTVYTYDFAGRKIKEKRDEREILYFYDALGNLVRTEQGDMISLSVYDLAQNLIETRIENSFGTITFKENYSYDEAGNRISTQTCQGISRTDYAQNLPIRQISPDGHSTSFDYDYKGKFTKITTDPLGVQKCEEHDQCGRLQEIYIKDPAKNIIQHRVFEYDRAGHQTKSTELIYEGNILSKSVSNTWEYGPCGRLEKVVESGIKKTGYLYDSCGRLSTLLKPDGTELYHEYDALGRLGRLTSSQKDIDYRYSYDLKDRMVEVFDAALQKTTKRAYDNSGNLIHETLANGFLLKSCYDPYGRRKALTYPDGASALFVYDADKLYQITYQGLTYTYQTRNLAGKPTVIDFPEGFIKIDYDSCLRWKQVDTSIYCAADYEYDPCGNLLSYRFGSNEIRYAYDPLHQLVNENDHAYSYDSHYNRLSKDHQRHTLNDLSQILSDGKTDFEYDLNGNLIRTKETKLVYDSLDRLIEVKKNGLNYLYEYDAFNRRILKKTPEETIHYLWDDKNEIGSSKQELRVLGEGFGAEIGAAVFIKLQGNLFVPLHDQRGAVIALVNRQGEVEEAIHYTAYGEETCGCGLSPWRFASKRVDEETGYVYFGKRYYCPPLGRWITTDPNGFKDGPNVYAYLHNGPLLSCDLYGLWHTPLGGSRNVIDFSCRLGRSLFEVVELVGMHLIPVPGIRDVVESIGRFGRGGEFSDLCEYQKNYSRVETIPGKAIEGHTIVCKNGMLTSFESAYADTQEKSLKIFDGAQVTLLYGGTQGLILDLLGCLASKLGIYTPEVGQGINFYREMFRNDPNHRFTSHVHSRGATILNNIGKYLTSEQCHQIKVHAYGPATLIHKEQFRTVYNYASYLDPVCILNPISYVMALIDPNSNVQFLTPSTWNPLAEHYMNGKTYERQFEKNGKDLVDEYFYK